MSCNFVVRTFVTKPIKNPENTTRRAKPKAPEIPSVALPLAQLWEVTRAEPQRSESGLKLDRESLPRERSRLGTVYRATVPQESEEEGEREAPGFLHWLRRPSRAFTCEGCEERRRYL